MTKYNKQVILALKKSELEMYNLGHSYVDIEHMILGILGFDNNIKNILNKYNITYDNYKKELISIKGSNNKKERFIFYNSRIKKIIDKSSNTTSEFSFKEVTLEYVFLNMLEEVDSLGIKILINQNININKLYKEVYKLNTNNNNLLIYEIGINLNDLAKNNKLDKVIGRKKEINQIIEILARKNKNNPILIGEAGVGKTAIIEALADKIEKKEVPNFLRNKIIVSLNIANVISGTKYRGEFEEKLTKILKECEDIDDIIIFIDEVHTIVGAGGAEGAIDASNILKPILARGNLKIIGATTINEYKKFISVDKALDRRFQKVYIKEPTKSETINILKKIKCDYEKFHNVKIKDNIIDNIVNLSNKYIFDRNEPDKSIDVLDESCAKANIESKIINNNLLESKLNTLIFKKEQAIKDENYKEAEKIKEQEQKILKSIKSQNSPKEVTYSIVKKVVESKCNSKIYDLEDNSNNYKNLESELNKIIIGQKEGIKELVNIYKVFNNKNNNSPISVMIYGNSGIGKTKCSKEFAEINKLNFIKLDMSEYSSEISVNKLLGAPQGYVGYNDSNTALESIKLNPNSLILLDEIDKAHPFIINLFLNILDEGYLKNSKDEKLNFNNCIFIMTTNNLNKENSVGYINKYENISETFPKEFVNRINYFIKFKSLNTSDIKLIIKNELTNLEKEYNKKINLKELDLNIILKECDIENSGARNIKNIIKKYIEKNLIASNTL